jgi:hypothetical protein
MYPGGGDVSKKQQVGLTARTAMAFLPVASTQDKNTRDKKEGRYSLWDLEGEQKLRRIP